MTAVKVSVCSNLKKRMGKKRKFYKGSKQQHYKRFKDGESGKVTAGVRGILVTHDRGKERPCTSDIFNILNYFANLWHGPELDQKLESLGENEQSESDNEEVDIDTALNAEVKDIKDAISNKKHNERRFALLKSGCNNIIFIRTHNINPTDLIQRIVTSLNVAEAKLPDCPLPRHILRVHPAATSCKAHLLDIKNEIESYLPDAFATVYKNQAEDNAFKKEFAILYRGRNNDHLGMHVVTEAVCNSAEAVVSDWQYNCRSDKVVLLIDVIQAVCMMSVVQNYAHHKKFNFRELCRPHTEKMFEKVPEESVSSNSGDVVE